MYKKILIPTDGSKYSKKAAEHAKWISNSSKGELFVLNVYETSSLNPIRSRELKKDMKKLWKEEAEKNLDGVLKILNNDRVDLKVHKQIKEGRPAEKILETAENENIDLIVIGSSGKDALDRLFIGSVADKVVKSANIPVLVVH
jgi:nucleotide-binding universal stress UspA family protein